MALELELEFGAALVLAAWCVVGKLKTVSALVSASVSVFVESLFKSMLFAAAAAACFAPANSACTRARLCVHESESAVGACLYVFAFVFVCSCLDPTS